MHGKQQSVGTIYGSTVCFRNGDNNLRAPIDFFRQQLRHTTYV